MTSLLCVGAHRAFVAVLSLHPSRVQQDVYIVSFPLEYFEKQYSGPPSCVAFAQSTPVAERFLVCVSQMNVTEDRLMMFVFAIAQPNSRVSRSLISL